MPCNRNNRRFVDSSRSQLLAVVPLSFYSRTHYSCYLSDTIHHRLVYYFSCINFLATNPFRQLESETMQHNNVRLYQYPYHYNTLRKNVWDDDVFVLVNSFRIGGSDLPHVHNSYDVLILHDGDAVTGRNSLYRSGLGLPLLCNHLTIPPLLLLHNVILPFIPARMITLLFWLLNLIGPHHKHSWLV